MIGPYVILGYAIVSKDDCIAGPDGHMPRALHDDEDWRRFQAALARAVVSVLGRLGHEQNANLLGRNRLVMSSSAGGIEKRGETTWWNPDKAPVAAALGAAAPAGGLVAVVGGRRVFDFFLTTGYDEFHLTRAAKVSIPGGIPVFSGIRPGRRAEAILVEHGLVSSVPEYLDRENDVSLTIWTPASEQ